MSLSTGAGSEMMARKQVILLCVGLYSRSFAVQICFRLTLQKLLTPRSVLSSPSPNNSPDSVLRTSFHDEPKKRRRRLVEYPSPAPQQLRHMTAKVLTSSSWPSRGIPWRRRGKPWHRQPSACHPPFSHTRSRSLHSTWRNTPLHEQTMCFDVRKTSRTADNTLHNPHRDACMRHGLSFRRPRAMRSDESTHRSQSNKLSRF